VAFVSGLCIGQDWEGLPERGIEPWRDTGIAIRGPAVADVARAFAQTWALAGEPLPEDEPSEARPLALAGDQAVRVIASTPATTGMLRPTCSGPRSRAGLWLTDAYFVGTWAYVEGLGSAARGSRRAAARAERERRRARGDARARSTARCSRRGSASSSGTGR
jgi:cardiolipin synthase